MHLRFSRVLLRLITSQFNPNSLHWRHNERDCVSNHQPYDCLLIRLFRRRSKKTSKLRATGLCAWNSPGTGEFPAQMASNAEMFPFDDVIMSLINCRSPLKLDNITRRKQCRKTTCVYFMRCTMQNDHNVQNPPIYVGVLLEFGNSAFNQWLIYT